MEDIMKKFLKISLVFVLTTIGLPIKMLLTGFVLGIAVPLVEYINDMTDGRERFRDDLYTEFKMWMNDRDDLITKFIIGDENNNDSNEDGDL